MVTMNFRVTWAASETFANHFKRAFQEDRIRETQMYAQSYQDLMSILENDVPMVDSQGRRLSYQRAVSGEDPMPSRYHDSSLKKKHLISEKSEVSYYSTNSCLKKMGMHPNNLWSPSYDSIKYHCYNSE